MLFTEVNVAYPVDGSRQRRLDGLRIINPPYAEGKAYAYGPENRSNIWELLESHPVELIEVHGWGFHAFGQVLGKAEILSNSLNPHDLRKTVITAEDWSNPKEKPDPATEDVYAKFDVNWVVL